jgi:hypothetical protein
LDFTWAFQKSDLFISFSIDFKSLIVLFLSKYFLYRFETEA